MLMSEIFVYDINYGSGYILSYTYLIFYQFLLNNLFFMIYNATCFRPQVLVCIWAVF